MCGKQHPGRGDAHRAGEGAAARAGLNERRHTVRRLRPILATRLAATLFGGGRHDQNWRFFSDKA